MTLELRNFQALFLKHHDELHLFARNIVADNYAAADIVQEVFVKLWQKSVNIQELDSPRSYLFRAVKNACINYLKQLASERKKNESFYDELQAREIFELNTGEKQILEIETISALNKAVDELPEKYKEVIVLSRYRGYSTKEIAEQLQLPVRTVETRIYRALTSLRRGFYKSIVLLSAFFSRKK